MSLHRECFSPTLCLHGLFREYAETSESAMGQLCFSAISKCYLSKCDVLFDANTMAEQMYFVVSGSVYYRKMKGLAGLKGIVRLTSDAWFCEPPLWVEWVHRGKMKAIIESELITVHAPAFREVTMGFPGNAMIARRAANEYKKWLEEHSDAGQVWDI